MIHRQFEAPVKIVTFFNFTSEPFSAAWDKAVYNFAPGEKVRMEDWKARHFAKHLVDKWCFDNGKENRRKEDAFINKMAEAIIEDGSSAATTAGEISRLKTELLSDGVTPDYPEESAAEIAAKMIDVKCQECGSKGLRHKNGCPKKNAPTV